MFPNKTRLATSVRRILIGGAALPLLVLGAGGCAQPDADPQGQPADAQPASTATELGNITVTAQSRTQEVQDVPIPMQIVTEKQIDALAATDLSKMNGYVPGLSVSGDQPTQPNFTLRGIGNGDFGIGTDSPIGIYVDGVYTGKTGGSLLTFNDIQRIEVLKGPQGTLFGRNSAGGAISIVPNEPADTWQEEARVRLGNYGLHYFDGVLNAPINENMAFRFSFVDNQSRGWLQDGATGQHYFKNDNWGTRAQFRWNAPGDTTVRVSWEHEELDQPARPAIGYVSLPPAPGLPALPVDPGTYIDPTHAPLLNDTIDGRETRNFDAVTLHIDHPFAWGELSSITAYRHFATMNREDDDGTNRQYLYFDTNNIEHNTSWYQEFKLSGKTGIADWVGGASWWKDDAQQISQLNFFTNSIDTLINNTTPFGPLYTELSQALAANGIPLTLLGDPWQENMFNVGKYKAYAVYGDVIWHLTDRLNLTTGVRFTRDEKEFSWYNPGRIAPELDGTLAVLDQLGFFDAVGVPIQTFQQNIEFNNPAAAGVPLIFKKSWNDTSPRIVLDYKIDPNLMLYASVAKGYEAGGFNSVQVGSTYDPEDVWNYEAGIKAYFPDQRLLFNASVYYYKYSNLQSLTLVDNGNGNLPLYLVTSSDQDAKGLDLEAHWQATDNLRLNATAAYIDAKYKHNIAPDGTDISGQPTGTPRWSAAFGAEYVWHNIAGGELDLILQHAYTGKSRCNDDSYVQGNCIITRAFDLNEATNRTDVRIGWSSPTMPWTIALFGTNIFDNRYVTGVNNITATTLGTPFASISQPRMWGVEFGVRF
ncbi:MAG TPA: TonB-dependent receptor [Rudaea sp.]